MIKIDRFVDDLPSCLALNEGIERLIVEILENWQTTGTLACSGDKDGPMVQKLGGAVLVIKWSTETDSPSR